MKPADERKIAEWIADAFAILCVRQSGSSSAEKKVRLGFEAILRHWGTPPLHLMAKSPPPPAGGGPTSADLRHIIKALDSCLAVFARTHSGLNPGQSRVRALVQATRQHAVEELQSRLTIVARRVNGRHSHSTHGPQAPSPDVLRHAAASDRSPLLNSPAESSAR